MITDKNDGNSNVIMSCSDSANLAVVGDIFPANLPTNTGLGVAASFDCGSPVELKNRLASLFKSADIVFGNLEAPLIDDSRQAAAVAFAGGGSFAEMLSGAGVRLVSIANNHIMEKGEAGFKSTLRILEDNRVQVTGLSINGASNVVVREVNGVTLGFASFNAINNLPNPERYAEYSETAVFRCIATMEELGVDRKIIAIHWGDEFVQYPSPEQMVSARRFVDAGVDVIIGHHPHVIQPVERYKQGIIFYSLGNFVFDMAWSRSVRTGLLAFIQLPREGDLGCDLRLVEIDKKDYFPRAVSFPKILKKKNGFVPNKNVDQYRAWYRKQKKNALLRHRILMKRTLLMNWTKLPSEVRRKLISNFRLIK